MRLPPWPSDIIFYVEVSSPIATITSLFHVEVASSHTRSLPQPFKRFSKPLAFKLFIVSDLHRPALLDAEVDWHYEIEPGMGCPSTTIVYVARKALLTSVKIDCSNPLAGL